MLFLFTIHLPLYGIIRGNGNTIPKQGSTQLQKKYVEHYIAYLWWHCE